MVATDILLTKNAYVEKTLNIGTNKESNARMTLHGGTDQPYLSIGQAGVDSTGGPLSGQGYDERGIFLGSVGTGDNDFRLSIKGGGDDPNFIKWTGTALELKGDIGGQVGKIEVGNIIIDTTGIRAVDNATPNPNTTFYLDSSNGDAEFIGKITSGSGKIGG
jgi:hypothetical protein